MVSCKFVNVGGGAERKRGGDGNTGNIKSRKTSGPFIMNELCRCLTKESSREWSEPWMFWYKRVTMNCVS